MLPIDSLQKSQSSTPDQFTTRTSFETQTSIRPSVQTHSSTRQSVQTHTSTRPSVLSHSNAHVTSQSVQLHSALPSLQTKHFEKKVAVVVDNKTKVKKSLKKESFVPQKQTSVNRVQVTAAPDLQYSPIFRIRPSKASLYPIVSTKSEISLHSQSPVQLTRSPIQPLRDIGLSSTKPSRRFVHQQTSELSSSKEEFVAIETSTPFLTSTQVSSQVESPINLFSTPQPSTTISPSTTSISISHIIQSGFQKSQELKRTNTIDQSDFNILQLALLFPGSKVK